MANVANTKNTGPTSKEVVSGGKKFPLKQSGSGGGKMKSLSNTSGEAQRAIMGLKVNPGSWGKMNPAAMTGKKAPR